MKPNYALEQRLIVKLFKESSVDYRQHYLGLFGAFNVWYKTVTGQSIDRIALSELKSRPVLWRQLFHDEQTSSLLSYTRRITILTHHRPLIRSGVAWPGSLKDPYDWRGLIDFWYAVRCDVVHGSSVTEDGYYPILLKLAYESLFAYMKEVSCRLQLCENTEMDGAGTRLSLVRHIITPSITEVDEAPPETFKKLFEYYEKEHLFRGDKPFTSA